MTKIKIKPFHMLITRVSVVLRDNAADLISVYTDFPSPFPPTVDDSPLSLTFQAAKGTGVEYVRKNFGIEPEVIDCQKAPWGV